MKRAGIHSQKWHAFCVCVCVCVKRTTNDRWINWCLPLFVLFVVVCLAIGRTLRIRMESFVHPALVYWLFWVGCLHIDVVGKCTVNPFICTDVVSLIINFIFINSANKQMWRGELRMEKKDSERQLVGGFLLQNYSRDRRASLVIHARSPARSLVRSLSPCVALQSCARRQIHKCNNKVYWHRVASPVCGVYWCVGRCTALWSHFQNTRRT